MTELFRRLSHTLTSLSWPRFFLLGLATLLLVIYATGRITATREVLDPETRDKVTQLLGAVTTPDTPGEQKELDEKKLEKAHVKVLVAGREIEAASRKLESALERIEDLIERRSALAEARKDIEEENLDRRKDGRPLLPLPAQTNADALASEISQALSVTIAEAVDQETAQYRLTANGLAVGLTLSLLLTLAVAKFLGGRRRVAEREAEGSRLEASCARLEKEATQARLAMLQAQIEPHFLFNTLASVDHLIQIDPAAASRMQKHLILYLRAAMPKMRESGSTLAREVELTQSYLAILKMRMEERLEYRFEIPETLANLAFPPMMLPTLVENAIKHGLEPKPEGGSIVVAARRSNGSLELSVVDTGVGFSPAPGNGVGLANIRERLALLYGERAKLEIVDNSPGTRATLILPLDAEAAAPPSDPCCD